MENLTKSTNAAVTISNNGLSSGKWIIITILVACVFIFWFGLKWFYAKMVSMDEDLKSKDAQISNMYDKRAEVLPQLADALKEIEKFEWGTITKVAEYRGTSSNLVKLQDMQKNGQISSDQFAALLATTLGGMRMMQENYPTLQGVAKFDAILSTTTATDDALRSAITTYNNSVSIYNQELRSFPYGVLFWKMLGFEKKDRTYAEVDKGVKVNKSPGKSFGN